MTRLYEVNANMGFRKSRGRNEMDRGREPRVNHRIRVPQVRLVGVEGEQLGIVAIEEAMRMAADYGVDLVEVAPTAKPPVCRIMDYGKFKYMQKKRAQEAKRSATHIEVKEVKLRPKTETHDYQTKMNRARRFLNANNRVKVTIMFRGREMAYTDAQRVRLNEIAQELSDISIVDVAPKMEGRTMSMMLNPKKGGSAAANAEKADKADKASKGAESTDSPEETDSSTTVVSRVGHLD